jgi:hypothetical protein
MLMINTGATFLALVVAAGVYYIMERRSLKAWWGDMRSGIMMLIARYAVHSLGRRELHEETWRPNILAFSGSPENRWYLVELASAISRNRGFVTFATIVPESTGGERITNLKKTLEEYLDRRGISALVKVFAASTPLAGARTLARAYGYGPIAPNTILTGETEEPANYREFAELVKAVQSHRQNLVVVRSGGTGEDVGMGGRIDLWWYGTQQNLGFMLAICHMLKLSPQWSAARLVLKNIVEDKQQQQGALDRLNSFVGGVRIQAEVTVLVKTTSDVFSMIRKNSEGASLVLLGMRAPREDEPAEAYSRYYAELLKRTSGLPPVAFVLAAEKMDFYSMFKERL